MQKRNSSNFSKIAFIALFGAMALTAFRLVSKPTNLLQGVLSPLPLSSLLVGSPPNSQNDEPADVAKFFAIEWTSSGVDLVLHRPEEVSTDALEVTLVGSTNLVTATWSPFMTVTFPAGDTNVSVTVSNAMLDTHSVSNVCFFAFINSGDSDADGLADWDERFNFKTDPYNAYSVLEGNQACANTPWMAHAFTDALAVKFGGHSPFEVLDDFRTVYEHAIHTGTWNGELTDDAVIGSGDVVVTLGIDKGPNLDASTLHVGNLSIPLCPGVETRLRIAIPAYLRAPIWHERDTDDYYDYYQFLDGIVAFEDSTAFLMKGVDSWAAYLGEVPEFLKAVEFPAGPVCVHGVDTRTLRVEFPEGPYNDEREGLFGYTCTWTALYPDGFAPCTDLSVVDRTDHQGSGECLKIDLGLDFPPDEVRRLRLEYVPVTEYMETYEYLAGPRSADIEVHCCHRPEWMCACAGHVRDGTSWRPWWLSPCQCNALVDPDDWDGDGLPNEDDPDPRGYAHPGVQDMFSRQACWTLWNDRTRFGDGVSGSLVYERTFLIRRTSAWQQFFLSSLADAASGWTLPAGTTLEWEDSGGAAGSAVASPVGDSLRLQLSKTAATVTFRLRAGAGFSATALASLSSLHLVGYVPDVEVSGQNVVDDGEPWREVDVFAGGIDAGVPIRIDRSGRPCFSPLAAEESDVAALVEDDFERGGLPLPGGGLGGPVGYVKDSGGEVETGTLYVPHAGLYLKPGDGLLDMLRVPSHFLVLDPSVVFGPDSCSDAGRIVWDAETDTHSPALDWPLDTACIRRAWRSDADGGWDELPEPMVDPGVDTNEYDFVDATLELADDGESCTGRVHVFGEEVWSGTAERRRRPCRGFDLADPFADGCGCCSGGCADGDCDALERPTVLDSSLCFRIPGGSPRKGQVSNFLSFAAPDPSSVSLGPALFKLTARPDASVEDATEGMVRTVACSDDRGRDVALESIPDGVRATVRDHATQRLEHTWEITRPNGSGSRIRFRRISRLDNTMDDLTFAYDWDTGSWTREDAVSGASETTEVAGGLDDPLAGNALVETKTTVGADGVPLVRTVVERTRLGSRRDAVLRETRRAEYGWDAAAETWHLASERFADYWDVPGQASFGKARLVRGGGEPWSYHDYDGEGREVLRVEQRNGSSVPDSFPWLDGDGALQIPLGFGDAFAAVFDYTPHAGDAGAAGDADLPRTETRYAVKDGNATLTARTWRRYTHPTSSSIPCVKCETWRAASQDASFGDAGNAYSYTVVYDEYAAGVPLAARGENAESLDEDGIRTVRACSQSPGRVVFTERRYKGDVEFPTYAVTELDATHGRPLRTATYVRQSVIGPDPVDNPSSADVLVDQEVNIYDEKNRLRSTTYLDGSVATNHYSCCRLLDRTDREGRKTLRSAVTGQDRLYYAEEDVWLGEISSGGGHRVTQHFLDVLGRETNTTTYVETTPGAAVDRDASAGHEVAVRETFYPRGTDDLVVRVDERGKTTTAETAGTQAGTTTTETVSTNGVVVTTTTTTSLRGGATTTRTAWNGGWTESRVEEDYAADGCRVVRRYRGASDMQEFLAETSTYDFLGRLVLSSRPGMNNGTVTTTTAYDGVSSRRVSSSTTGSPAVSYAYDQLGELATTTCDGVSQTVATSYERDPDDGELYKVERAWRTVPAMFVDSVRTRETRTRLTGLSADGLLERRVVVGEDGHETVEERSRCVDPGWAMQGVVEGFRQTGDGAPETSYGKYGFSLWEYGVGGSSTLDYDALGRKLYVIRRDELDMDSYSSLEYDCSGNVVWDFESPSQMSQVGHVLTTVDFDELGNETVRRTELSYNPSGRPTVEYAVTNSYDALERTVLVGGSTYPVGTSYDAEGRKTASRTTRNDGDSWDETAWTYDRRSGLNTAKQYADGSSVTRTYTDEGRPVRTTWARGAWRENAYDARGLLSGVSHSSPATTPDVAFTHNAAGLVATASCGTMVSTAYTYDSHLNCTEEASTVDGQSFTLSRTFDEFIRPSSVSISSGGTAYAAKTRTYDSENRVSGYTLGGDGTSNSGISVSVSYAGHLPVGTTYTFPNGNTLTLALAREPGRSTWITRRDYAFNNTTLYWHRTAYDAQGRPMETEDSLTAIRQWLYNRRSELVGATGTQAHPYDYAYSYDSIGNRLTSSDDFGTATYAANSLNQYTAVNRAIDQSEQLVLRSFSEGGSNNFTYDADGNLTNDGRNAYAYDCENRLVSVTPLNPQVGSLAIENVYDHRSRRIKKIVRHYDGSGMGWNVESTHVFVWDGWNIVFEQITFADNTTRTIEYFWGNDVSGTEQGAGGVGGLLATRIDGVFYIPVYGANGNIMMYVSESGSIAAQYDYDPYGNILQASGPLASQFALGFSTKYHDREVGLVAYQLRTYNPTHGRWLNRDPVGENGGINLYAYCNGNPLYYVDVKGENPVIALFIIAALWYPQIANAPTNREEAQSATSTIGAFGVIVDHTAAKMISVAVMCCGKLWGYVLFRYYERVALRAVENAILDNKTASAIGAAFDPRQGSVVVAVSGEYVGTPTTVMQEIAEKLGGLHQKASCCNPIGACVEFKGADMLIRQNSFITDIRFTKVIRPRNGLVLKPCPHCQKMLDYFETGAIDMGWSLDLPWTPATLWGEKYWSNR